MNPMKQLKRDNFMNQLLSQTLDDFKKRHGPLDKDDRVHLLNFLLGVAPKEEAVMVCMTNVTRICSQELIR